MSIFVLKKLTAFEGVQEFCFLCIKGECQFELFENQIIREKRYLSELTSIYAYMEYVANNRSVPFSHFKDITPVREQIKEYEFRTKNIRVYAIDMANGKIIILAGFKNSQKKDIRRFRSIKKQFTASLKK